jgi:hypothetical protein
MANPIPDMMLAHGSVGAIYAIMFALWLANLAMLLPALLTRRPHVPLLIITILVTLFDVWVVRTAFLEAFHSGLSIESWVSLALFGTLLLCGCAGVIRWFRISK